MTVSWTSIAALLVSFGTVANAGDAPASERLTVTDKGSAYELTVPVGRLMLTIPKGHFVQSSPAAGSSSPRYFFLEDKQAGVIVSGWFEPAQGFQGMETFWAGERDDLKAHGFEPEDVVLDGAGKWKIVAYDVRAGEARQSNIRAEWVEAETWIDLHLSQTSKLETNAMRKQLRDCLASIQVSLKAP
jgi:hypothetical protein